MGLKFAQIVTGHFLRLFDFQHSQKRRYDIGQRSIRRQASFELRVEEDERNGVCRVCCMWLAGGGVSHEFGIAMV